VCSGPRLNGPECVSAGSLNRQDEETKARTVGSFGNFGPNGEAFVRDTIPILQGSLNILKGLALVVLHPALGHSLALLCARPNID
jgi:hypothetical protein